MFFGMFVNKLKRITNEANENKELTKLAFEICEEEAKQGNSLAWIPVKDVDFTIKNTTSKKLEREGLHVDDLGNFLQVMW